MRSLFLAACAVLLAGPALAVNIDWVDVGAPGNACDPQLQGCFGAVARPYRIAKTEVTNAQYVEFLNQVAVADPNGLYNTRMASAVAGDHGGIVQSGSPGSFAYSTIVGRASMPVNLVSFYDALRFANWLHNGQPTGAQGNATTEDGSYTITTAGIAANSITRNAGARIFLPSEDEWYKAAYFDAVSTSYFAYPAGTNTQTICFGPDPGPNVANCDDAVGDLTPVGSYPASASPSGTFDQGGNAFELNEEIAGGDFRGKRGGSFSDAALSAASQSIAFPITETSNIGFRVASVPEPTMSLLLLAGTLGIIASRRARR